MITKFKQFENRFTDLFKPKEYGIASLYMQDQLKDLNKYTTLMYCAEDGDIKKFKNYFNEFTPNEVDHIGSTTLIHVATGKGSFRNKKEMIEMLIDAGEDPFIINTENESFMDFIEPKLKQWLFETYPDIELKYNANIYNL